MSDNEFTLLDVAESCMQITRLPCDEETVRTYTAHAATVRAADELLGRTLSQVRCDMWKFTDADCGKCEPCELIADIRKIRGGTQ